MFNETNDSRAWETLFILLYPAQMRNFQPRRANSTIEDSTETVAISSLAIFKTGLASPDLGPG